MFLFKFIVVLAEIKVVHYSANIKISDAFFLMQGLPKQFNKKHWLVLKVWRHTINTMCSKIILIHVIKKKKINKVCDWSNIYVEGKMPKKINECFKNAIIYVFCLKKSISKTYKKLTHYSCWPSYVQVFITFTTPQGDLTSLIL